jgi:transposase-like protein
LAGDSQDRNFTAAPLKFSPEVDHGAIKRIIKPMMGFKDFRCAHIILSSIEVMHMIRKGQMKTTKGTSPSAAKQFYSLVM